MKTSLVACFLGICLGALVLCTESDSADPTSTGRPFGSDSTATLPPSQIRPGQPLLAQLRYEHGPDDRSPTPRRRPSSPREAPRETPPPTPEPIPEIPSTPPSQPEPEVSARLRHLVRRIEQGNDQARKEMAVLCYDGEAMAWIRNAAHQGDPDAQFALGRTYHLGIGVSRDYDLARHWYLKAADRNSAGAECNLGYMYHHGSGVPKDRRAAFTWFTRAAAHGDTDALRMLETKYGN